MIDCKAIAAERKKFLKEYIEQNNKEVCLMVIQVGDDQASNSYIRGKMRDCSEIGVQFLHKRFETSVTTDDIIRTIETANESDSVTGIIVQLPLPSHLDKDRILNAVADSKDVDGFKHGSPYIPCTPKGVMNILNAIHCDVDGKLCCVIGRGEVGKPMVDLLTKHNATVLWCNSHTPSSDLERYIFMADVIISATGKPKLIQTVRNGQVVIDVGIHRGDDGKLCGDVDKACYRDDAQITPVPGGVGLMTRAALLENVVLAFSIKI